MFCCLTTYFQSWAKHNIRAIVPRETLGVLRRICFGCVVRERGVRRERDVFWIRASRSCVFSCYYFFVRVKWRHARNPVQSEHGVSWTSCSLNVSDVGHVHLVVDRSRVHDDLPCVVRERA